MELVDPELRPMLELWPSFSLSTETLPQLRISPPLQPAAEDDGVLAERRTIAGPPGAPEVPLHIYRAPGGSRARGCVLHIHGGGFVLGHARSLEFRHRPLSLELDCVLVSVDYRLAPETIFPGALEDCYAALAWLHANAADLGIDPHRIGITGESAGGGLAAALCLLARDRGEYRIAFQNLVYPMLDDRTCTTTEPHPHTGRHVWTADSNRFGWRALLGREPGGDGVSPYAAPARADNLSDLPKAFISTGTLDLFVEEDLEYARRLIRAGVPTELHVYPGAFHGFDLMAGADVAARATADRKAALRRALLT